MTTPRFVPPSPPPPGDPRGQSVAELEGLVVDPGTYELGSQAWASRALVSPIWQLGAQDLRLLLDRGRGLRWLVPEALGRLERDPWVGGDRGPGELLLATCLVAQGVWDADAALLQRLRGVLASAEARLGELADPAAREHWAGELQLAREQFGA